MLNYTKMLSIDPFSLSKKEKDDWFLKNQKILSKYHYENCSEYQNILNKLDFGLKNIVGIKDVPYIPARLFKEINLKSTSENEVAVTLTSSGTSGNNVSKISLDKKTSLLQSRVLNKIFSTVLPKKKIPMFCVEPKKLQKSNIINARVAATRGFSQFVSEKFFLLNEQYSLSIDTLVNFIFNNKDEPFLIFGFTSLLWMNLINEMENNNIRLPKNNGIIIHGGGWKKIYDQAVSREKFNKTIKEILGINSIHNYYGMVEQTGSIFLECEEGYYHPSIFSDVIIRNTNLDTANLHEEGLIQVLSLLPQSYPGHSILTEDVGTLVGVDNCKCGRKGKYFVVKGRVKGVELRGCSDTY